MSWVKRRRTAAVSAVVLFLWMFWNLLSGPTYEFQGSEYFEDKPAFDIRCEPMLWRASWISEWRTGSVDGHHHTYDVTAGLEPRSEAFRDEWERRHRGRPFDLAEAQDLVDDEIENELSARCADARTGQAGLMAVVAVPTSVLAVIGFGRRRHEEPGAPRDA